MSFTSYKPCLENKWHVRFINLAMHVSSWSKDPSTKVGAVIARGKTIVSVGYNGFPSKIRDDDRLNDREKKSKIILHAEDNALMHAVGDIHGCTMYTYPFLPCPRCAARCIQHGIGLIVSIDKEPPERWRDDISFSADMLREAGIGIIKVNSKSLKGYPE